MSLGLARNSRNGVISVSDMILQGFDTFGKPALSTLHEYAQRKGIKYSFTVDVKEEKSRNTYHGAQLVFDGVVFHGEGQSVKKAQQRAAEKAIKHINSDDCDYKKVLPAVALNTVCLKYGLHLKIILDTYYQENLNRTVNVVKYVLGNKVFSGEHFNQCTAKNEAIMKILDELRGIIVYLDTKLANTIWDKPPSLQLYKIAVLNDMDISFKEVLTEKSVDGNVVTTECTVGTHKVLHRELGKEKSKDGAAQSMLDYLQSIRINMDDSGYRSRYQDAADQFENIMRYTDRPELIPDVRYNCSTIRNVVTYETKVSVDGKEVITCAKSLTQSKRLAMTAVLKALGYSTERKILLDKSSVNNADNDDHLTEELKNMHLPKNEQSVCDRSSSKNETVQAANLVNKAANNNYLKEEPKCVRVQENERPVSYESLPKSQVVQMAFKSARECLNDRFKEKPRNYSQQLWSRKKC